MQIISAAGFTPIPPTDKMGNFLILKSPIKFLAQMCIYNHTNSYHNNYKNFKPSALAPCLPCVLQRCTHVFCFLVSSFVLRWPDPHPPELVTSIWMMGPGSAVSVYVMWCGLLHPPLLSSLSVLRWAASEAQMGDTGQSRDDSATGQTWVAVRMVFSL